MVDVEKHLCRQVKGDKIVECPLLRVCDCAYQEQKQVEANIWFAAHECMVHEMPKAFGDVGWVIVDETPLDAFMLGVDVNDEIELELDALRSEEVPAKLNEDQAKLLRDGRRLLYDAFDKLKIPNRRGAATTRETFEAFEPGSLWNAKLMHALEWKGKVKPDINPSMSEKQVKRELQKVEGNALVKKRATLWKMIEEATLTCDERHGRIQLHRNKSGGREIRMVGMREVAKDWRLQTLICDATADAELLQRVWPDLLECGNWQGWQQLPRPKSVRYFQCVDRALSKFAVAVEGKDDDRKRRVDGARRMYASLLMKALEYGGADVGVIVYKSTREWIEQNCFVPTWLKLTHWGDVTGTNTFEHVSALFVVGRPLASPEDVALQVEALCGGYVAAREYKGRKKKGRIPIVPDAKGYDAIRVDVLEMDDPMAGRVVRQITVAAIIQAVGRARAGLRKDEEPLDIHLWTDVPVPELGAVEPVLWKELEAGLDGIMLATGGIWLQCIRDAGRAYKGLFTVEALKKARSRGVGTSLIGSLISNVPTPPFRYQLAGKGQKPQQALALVDPTSARAWLEKQLGAALARFEHHDTGL